jgi:hypothetical protein
VEGVHGISAANTNCKALDVYGCESAGMKICMNNWNHQLECGKNKTGQSPIHTNKQRRVFFSKKANTSTHAHDGEKSQDITTRLSLHKC